MTDAGKSMEVDVKPHAAQEHVIKQQDSLTLYPAALATHEEVVDQEKRDLFKALLQDLNAKLQTAEPRKFRPSKYRVPTAAGRDLDLQQLYRQVTGLGGAIAVTVDNKWTEVIAAFQFPSKVNVSAIRKIYSQQLWHFEQVYQHKAEGQQLQEPPELAAAAAAAEGAVATAAEHLRPSRNRRGANLAAIIAADTQDSDEEGGGNATATPGGDTAGRAAKQQQQGADTTKQAAATPAAGAVKPEVKTETGKPAAAAAAAAAPGSASKPQRNRGQQRGLAPSAAAAAGKTPELVGFLKAGRARKDLTGQNVTGKVDAKFDCGYFVSLNIAGQSFNGILYCPTAVAAAAAAGAQANHTKATAAAGVKKEAPAGGRQQQQQQNNGVVVKTEAGDGDDGAAAAAGGAAGGGSSRGTKRRRGSQPAAGGDLSANKPKSAKTAFNFFAAEQWALVKAELGPSAIPQDISRAVGERWNKTSEGERQPYIDKALQDKGRFDKQMADWRRQGLESPGPAGDVEPAAATPEQQQQQQQPAAVPTDGTAADGPVAGSTGVEAMDVDGGAAAAATTAQEQQQQQPQHVKPKLKLKLAHHAAGPAAPAAAAAVPEAAGAAGVAAAEGADIPSVTLANCAAPPQIVPAAPQTETAAAVEEVPAASQPTPAPPLEAPPLEAAPVQQPTETIADPSVADPAQT